MAGGATPIHDYAGYESLTARSAVAIAGGERLTTWTEPRWLDSGRLFDIVQPDVTICGGIGNALRIAELATVRAMKFVPHSCNGAVGMAATLHLLSLLEPQTASPAMHPPMLEIDFSENPHLRELLTEPLPIVDGSIEVPTGPGLGIDIDERYLREHARVSRRVPASGT